MASKIPTLRALAVAWAVAFGVLMLVTLLAFGWSSASLRDATAEVVRDTTSVKLATQLQLQLHAFQRLSNIYFVTSSSAMVPTIREIERDIRELQNQLSTHVGSREEAELVAGLPPLIDQYLATRRDLARKAAPVAEAIRVTQPSFDALRNHLQEIVDVNERTVAAATARSRQLVTLSNLISVATMGILLLALVTAVLLLHRYVIVPTNKLRDEVTTFRGGDYRARTRPSGVREAQELAGAFNAMADALVQQREQQLTFLAGVAHDLRNPLNALKLAVSGLGSPDAGPSQVRLHSLAERQIDKLARMIEDLLDATRIEAGHLELKTQPMDLRDAAREIVSLYGPTSPEHTIRLEEPPQPVMIVADPLRVEQVISNLVSNAIKFSPQGGDVLVGVEPHDRFAVVWVTDHGIGIAPQEIPELFAPFRRRRPDVAPGAGLGLSVLRHIVHAHGGEVDVESELGVGSTFRVKLPLRAHRDPTEPNSRNHPTAA